jgi:hypothetical protein
MKALQEQNEVYFKDITNRLERIERLLDVKWHVAHQPIKSIFIPMVNFKSF